MTQSGEDGATGENVRSVDAVQGSDARDSEGLINLISSRINAIVSTLRYQEGLDALVDDLEFVELVYGELVGVDPTSVHPLLPFRLAEIFSLSSLRQVADLLENLPSAALDTSEWRAYVSELKALVRAQLESAYAGLANTGSVKSKVTAESLVNLIEREKMRSKLGEITFAAERAKITINNIEEAAGEVAESELAKHFSSLARYERRVAEVTRGGVMLIAIVVTIYAIAAFGSAERDFSWLELARKSALTLPGLALAAYLARESSRHRNTANWAETISVQLKTVKAYTTGLSADARDKIRAEFGKRVFSQQAIEIEDRSGDSLSGMLSEIRALGDRSDKQ